MASSIDDIWASMNESAKPLSATTVGAKKTKRDKSTKAAAKTTDKGKIEASAVVPTITYSEMRSKLMRDINCLNESDTSSKKRSLVKIHTALFEEFTMSTEDYAELFRDICKPIFKRFNDPTEKCRELSQKITKCFFERCSDLVPILGYYFPSLMQRLPGDLGYDESMKIFVYDLDAHDAYKRGKAVDRQDKGGTVDGVRTHIVVEPSEEIRLLSCTALNALIERVVSIDATPVLHPYFQEMIMFLQFQLRDPFPDLKLAACTALDQLARLDEFELGMKFFAVGLSRALLPVLRHRHAKVRVAALSALKSCITVKDRAKRKGAGTEAITDLVGFREENVLPVAAFYTPDVQINYIAELVVDKSVAVKEQLVALLTALLTEIGDRYDHHTRLLPYILDLLADDNDGVANGALSCLTKCGQEYESEHADEIIERRQYGVDGDKRINLEKPLPRPFLERPRLGIRLYVRGNTKRFLTALVGELTNWVSHTRLKSAQLMKLVVVLCEEHLTMEAHVLFPALLKALRFAHDDKDSELHQLLLELFELFGRYMAPEVYVYYILPRLRGDPDVVQFGVDSETRVCVLEFLQQLLEGSKASTITPYFEELVAAITDPYIISPDSIKLQKAAMDVMMTMMTALKGRGNAVVAAHFLSTGRLSTMHKTLQRAFQFLLGNLPNTELMDKASLCLMALASLESDAAIKADSVLNNAPLASDNLQYIPVNVQQLFIRYSNSMFLALITDFELDSTWNDGNGGVEHLLIKIIAENPQNTVQNDPVALANGLKFACNVVKKSRRMGEIDMKTETENSLLMAYVLLIKNLIKPVYCTAKYSDTNLSIYSKVAAASTSSQQSHKKMCHDGLLPMYGAAAQTEAANVISSLFETIFSDVLNDGRFTRTPELQTERLSLVSTLLDGHPVGDETYQLLRAVTADGGGREGENENNSTSVELPAPLCNIECMIKFGPVLLQTVLPSAFVAASPLPLRRHCLAVATHFAERVHLMAGFRGHKLVLGSNNDASRAALLKVSVAPAMDAILEMALVDANDGIRCGAIRALISVVQLLASIEQIAEANQQQQQQPVTVVSMGNSYVDIVSRLIKQSELEVYAGGSSSAVLADDDDNYMGLLDCLLRSLAVFDPPRFEQILRAEYEAMSIARVGVAASAEEAGDVKKNGLPDNLTEFLNGLFNHVDILGMLTPNRK